MTVLDQAINAYFAAERGTGLALIPFGVVAAAAALWVWRAGSGGFAIGLAIPLALLALLSVGVGSTLALKTPSQAETLKVGLAANEAPVLAEEIARMDKVNANWMPLKIAWAALGLIGFGLILWNVRDWATGLALALLVMSVSFMVLDIFAERRAEVYAGALATARDPGA